MGDEPGEQEDEMATTAAERRTPTLRYVPRVGELRKIRAEFGITYAVLAQDLNGGLHDLNKVFNGHRNPSPDLAKRIARYFDVPVADLFNIEDLNAQTRATAA